MEFLQLEVPINAYIPLTTNRQLIVSGFCDSQIVIKPQFLLDPAFYVNRDKVFELPLTLYNNSLAKSTL